MDYLTGSETNGEVTIQPFACNCNGCQGGCKGCAGDCSGCNGGCSSCSGGFIF